MSQPPQVDIFSLGSVMYELISLRGPGEFQGMVELMAKGGRPPLPSKVSGHHCQSRDNSVQLLPPSTPNSVCQPLWPMLATACYSVCVQDFLLTFFSCPCYSSEPNIPCPAAGAHGVVLA